MQKRVIVECTLASIRLIVFHTMTRRIQYIMKLNKVERYHGEMMIQKLLQQK